MESDHWLHKGQSWLQILLCRAHGKKTQGHETTKLCEWI